MPETPQAMRARLHAFLDQVPDDKLAFILATLGLVTPSSERAKVEANYNRFSEVFAKTRTSKADFMRAFDALQKRNPGLSAEQFLKLGKSSR
jgi:hypothetical protein